MKAKYRDKSFDIPEMWWVGFSQAHPDMTPHDIIRWWAWQDYMDETGEAPPEDY